MKCCEVCFGWTGIREVFCVCREGLVDRVSLLGCMCLVAGLCGFLSVAGGIARGYMAERL